MLYKPDFRTLETTNMLTDMEWCVLKIKSCEFKFWLIYMSKMAVCSKCWSSVRFDLKKAYLLKLKTAVVDKRELYW